MQSTTMQTLITFGIKSMKKKNIHKSQMKSIDCVVIALHLVKRKPLNLKSNKESHKKRRLLTHPACRKSESQSL